jgi:hypothetical protein
VCAVACARADHMATRGRQLVAAVCSLLWIDDIYLPMHHACHHRPMESRKLFPATVRIIPAHALPEENLGQCVRVLRDRSIHLDSNAKMCRA